MLQRFLVLLGILFAAISAASANTEWEAEPPPPDIAVISYSTRENRRIMELSLNYLDVPVQFTSYGAPIVELQGKFLNKYSTLIWERYKILDPPFSTSEGSRSDLIPQEFSFSVPLKGVSTFVTLVAVDYFGRERHEDLVITYPGYGKRFNPNSRRVPASTGPIPTSRAYSLAVGYTSISYQETNIISLSQTALTAKGSFQTKISSNWSIALGSYFNALALTTDSGQNTLQFLGVNGRIGYSLPWVPQPWKVSLMGGMYYMTSFAKPSNQFGFNNMMGPQIYPQIQYQFANRDSFYIYGKYSPISRGGFDFTFASTEIAAGGGYNYATSNGQAISFSIDYAQVNLDFLNILQVKSDSLTMSVGYVW
jgi:hypothetical protein